MNAKSLIFRKLTLNEFKAITNTINAEGGGSQTYIDFPKGCISDDELNEFFGFVGNSNRNGFEWEFYVNSLSLGRTKQKEVISARRNSSNSLREQNNKNRIEIWKNEHSGFPSESYDDRNNPIIIYILKSDDNEFWAGWFYRNDSNDTWPMTKGLSTMLWKDCAYVKFDNPIYFDENQFAWPFLKSSSIRKKKVINQYSQQSYLSALRTKPFMLLAGISGTGKSRLVREMAFMSCPKALQDQDQTQPGNYCMIEVKPNWHDSTELLGYWSNISKKYMFTPFVKFLVKAMMYPDVPFFVCLDEMNLAPVEQYLAELLSVLETRKRTGDKRIRTGVLVNSEYFEKLAGVDGTHDANGKSFINLKTDGEIYMKLLNLESLKGGENEEALAAKTLRTSGLTLPDNVVIIGTVNMDDTTHKFSRKVIDRAMTIEMNGGELNSIFGGSSRLEYRADNEVVGIDAFKAKYVSADDAINDCLRMSPFAERITGGEEDDGTLAHRLKAINDCLEGTPFQVSYRVMNELVIYLAVLLDSEDGEVSEERFDELMSKAVDDILLMKILPRIEGDEQMFVTSGGNRLDSLLELTSPDSASHKKLLEMKERLEKSFFTRFWP